MSDNKDLTTFITNSEEAHNAHALSINALHPALKAAVPIAASGDAMCPKGQAFKDYVHQRLDAMDVPHSVPESEHDKAGCRIGGCLDWVEALRSQGQAVDPRWQFVEQAYDRAKTSTCERLLDCLGLPHAHDDAHMPLSWHIDRALAQQASVARFDSRVDRNDTVPFDPDAAALAQPDKPR